MSMGLYEKYVFPEMYTSPELNDATEKLIAAARKNNTILGPFLFGTDRVGEFLEKGFTFISIGSEMHHALTQAATHVKKLEEIAGAQGKPWKHQPSNLV
ncbi:HpcH/HpaI aldolase/citrate lyase domain [Trypanosoma melophagium]|uniref:HpcH/HpaI aldolase/citrate lyase domain n=1 Tax=Trypanosoma melophagium TaxID=715481 RepID=UPI00351A9384|nr:HpcH/HpaI aldolase/citrate lyase domain [Trypanosoma melophagium]KAH9599605.1 HpcH/HpaI aldolase/citrate lyase domain [Trypanosoma melophagium]